MLTELPFWPQEASTVAGNVDALTMFIALVTAFFSILIFLLILYFSIHYRRRPGRVAVPMNASLPLEVLWTVVPLGLTAVMFTWGSGLYMHNQQDPPNAMNIYVVGKQWMWTVEHLEGRREIGELHVPAGRPVKLILASQDVIHDFFIPAFRVKQDVVPGRYTTMWFEASRIGNYRFVCAQYCGTQHSGMIGRVIVMEPQEYQAWLASGADDPPAIAGERLFHTFSCAGCHELQPTQKGPPLIGMYGKSVRMESGATVAFDDAYIRESILNPNDQVVEGYRPIMPTFRNQLTEDEIIQLIAYIRSLGAGDAKP
jgi:cytochrome c oxidase subunit 2